MNILFVHQNFPGQFLHLAPALARDRSNRVVALHANTVAPILPGVEAVSYRLTRAQAPGIHPWLSDLETKVIRGEAVYRVAKSMRAAGFIPDVIIAHPGWGESLFLKDVWPRARLGMYCEYYYRAEGGDLGFDPEFATSDEDAESRLRLRNAFYDLQEKDIAAGISPTEWQRSTFPQSWRSKITVVHEGIDTNVVTPNEAVSLEFRALDGRRFRLTRRDEVVTFVSRNLEPYRGYHTFMRALSAVLRARPNARILIVGGQGASYGPLPSQVAGWENRGKTWKEIFLNEVRSELDMNRVHFMGWLPFTQHLALLQLSTVHVYLTYPFVLSWSLLEAMSAGCAIVASDTKPVREVIVHGETGRLCGFFDATAIAEEIIGLLSNSKERLRLGFAARESAIADFDLQGTCIHNQILWLKRLIASRSDSQRK